jgi:tRNA A-37 threonylcarbamoyl transferase component Bud32
MVGGYRVEYELGAGGVGTVYAAEEPTIKKRVAIKVLKRAFVADAAAEERFEREARAANAIRHPGIVDVFAFGKLDDGRPYLVMSLLEGRSLRDELAAKGSLSPEEAWRIAREIAEALTAAHAEGIVHRDLKPDNVFLERFPGKADRPRILDFGIAKVQAFADGPELQKLTLTGAPIGTPRYMAPEQWWGQEISPRTDQYCFGAMLFEMLAGRPPFLGQQYMELAQQHVHDAPPSLHALLGLDPAIEALVAKAMAKAPEDRFESMTELVEAGDRAFAKSESAAEFKAISTSQPASPIAAASVVKAAPDARRATRRFIAIHVLVLAFGFALLVAIGYAGPNPHDVVTWINIGGGAQYASLTIFAGVAIALPFFARRRAKTGKPDRVTFWLALFPGVSGTFGTYTGWLVLTKYLETSAPMAAHATFNSGMYEANSMRFLGFGLASILLVSLAALPGVTGLDAVSHTLVGQFGLARKESLGAAAGLAVLAVLAIVVGAPAAAFVGIVGAGVLAVGSALPTLNAETAARDELERAIAGLLAVGLATAVAFTRIEAREAVLWDATPNRAARVAEILAAADERSATTRLAVAALLVVTVVEALRLRRIFRRGERFRPTTATAALVVVLAIAVSGDAVLHGRFIAMRDALRVSIAAQFADFARLRLPSGDALDAAKFPPHRAPALQITRDAIAVNAKGVAKIAALENPEGAAHVADELGRALAQASVEASAPNESDLAVFADKELSSGVLIDLLRIAKHGGASKVDLMLGIGPAPKVPKNAPPEVQILVPRDAVALPIELVEQGGLPIDARASVDHTADALVTLALAGKAPVKISVGAAR